MLTEIGHVDAVFRYPVKSMAGERLEAAQLGWHGIEGDRRLALRRVNDRGGFPFLTASTMPDLVRFVPLRRDGDPGEMPSHIRTPEGEEFSVFGEQLAAEISRRCGTPVEMMQMRHGIFDEASLSVIATDTVREIGRLSGGRFAGQELDVRRFRPNVLVRLLRPAPFREDDWVGGALVFGDGEDATAINVTMRDERCAMVNIDPDSGAIATEVMKAIVRERQNLAGVYGTVTRVGRVMVGQRVWLKAGTGN
jgi:uncharacterized protein YcbX